LFYLCETFISLQGEGRYRGYKSHFFRFGGCNRVCSEFGVEYEIDGVKKLGCDSYYGVDRGFVSFWSEVSAKTLIKILKKTDLKRVVITGGEPLIYWQNSDFREFVEYLLKNSYLVTIETNGDLEIEYKSLYDDIIFSISPKDEVQMKWYWTKNRNSYLKIVHNFGDISDLWIKNMSKVMDIFIMPKGESKKELELDKKEAFCML